MFLTRKQREAVHKLWLRSKEFDNPDPRSYIEFRRSVMPGFHPGEEIGYVGVMWGGMYVGIEPDGYTHT